MNQYGQSDLVNNPRYQGQAQGTNMQGPAGESRYGAMPMSTGTGNAPADLLETIRDPAAYGFKKNYPEGYRFPGMPGVGVQQQNLAAPNAQPSQAGYGSSQPGYGQHLDISPNNDQTQTNRPVLDEFAKEQPGYGQPGFAQPSQGQNTGNLWPTPTAPLNARRSDLVGQGGVDQSGYGNQGYGQPQKDAVGVGPNSGYNNPTNDPNYGTQAFGNQGKEGLVNRARDDVGVGPNSGYNNQGNQPGYGNQGYGNQGREGLVNRAKDNVGVGPNSGFNNQGNQPGYGNQGHGNQGSGNQGREGVVNRARDDMGVGPNSGYNNQGNQPGYGNQGYNPNVNYPNEERGFGGGLGQPPQGTNTGYDQSQSLGSGYDNRMATGADAYGQPARVGNMTGTGVDAYVAGNNSPGMQDRITGVNEPTVLGGRQGVNNPNLVGTGIASGDQIPQTALGERRTEPGYDASRGNISNQGGFSHF